MVEKISHVITLIGCDDETKMQVELTTDEADLIRRIAELSEETSQYKCQPTMTITEGVLPKDRYE